MMFRSFSKKKFLPALFSGFLILTFILLPISQTLELKKAEAIPVVVTSGLGTLQETFTAIATGASKILETDGWQKEYILDPILYALVNTLLKEMINSVTEWVNNGFEGSPAFVTDLEGFLREAGDKVAGNFIFADPGPLSGLCKAFGVDIKHALTLQYAKTDSYEAECTLEKIVSNTEKFFGGDFLEGGWKGWFSMTTEPKNNPYGALLEAQEEVATQVANQKSREARILDFGSGFVSLRDPACKPNPDKPDEFNPELCTVVTPGKVIESQLNETLSIPTGRLLVADEINELIGAVFTQLVSSVMNSDTGGLRGLTDSSYGPGSGTYFDRLRDEPDPGGLSADTLFDMSLSEEKRYRDNLQRLIDLITEAGTYKDREYGELNNCSSGELTESLEETLSSAEDELAETEALIEKIEEFKSDSQALNNLSTTTGALHAIQEVLTKYDATSKAEAMLNLLSEFNAFKSSGGLHTIQEQGLLEGLALPRAEEEVEAFIKEIDDSCKGTEFSGDLSNHPSIVPPVPVGQVMQPRLHGTGGILSFPIPVPLQGRASIVFKQGQQSVSPDGVFEFYVSKRPGEVPDIPQSRQQSTPNYSRSLNNHYSSLDIFTREVLEMGLDEETILETRHWYAPRDEGQWYVNVRWTWTDPCPFGGGCGFSIQWVTGSI